LFFWIRSNAWLIKALISSFSLFLIINSSWELIFLMDREGFVVLNISGIWLEVNVIEFCLTGVFDDNDLDKGDSEIFELLLLNEVLK